MKSSKPAAGEICLPDDPEGSRAQQLLKGVAPPMSLEEYFRFLRQFGDADPEVLRKKRGPCGPEPFRLV